MHRRQLRILPLLLMSLVLYPSTPDALITVGIHTPARPRSVAVVGDLAYVASDPSGLSVLDVSNPAAPIELGAIDTPGQANGVAVAGGIAYVADGYAGLRAIDVSNPTAPIELGAAGIPGYANDVAVVGGFAYVAAQLAGLRIIDISNPAAPVEIGALDTPGQALRVAVVSGLAYLADGTSGLRVIDVSNPAAPIEIGALEDPQFASSVAVEGALAFVAGGAWGLSVVDVSNPTSPAVIGTLAMPRTFSPVDVAVAGELVFVIDIGARLIPVDVSNPASPTLIGTLGRGTRWFLGDDPFSRVLAISENLVYVAHPSGLVVVDASDPAALEPISISGPVGSLRDVEVADGLAYVANGTAGLQVLDISTPSAPVEIGAVDTPGFAVSVERVGTLAYVCDDSGLRIIDVSDPAAPIEIGAIDTPGSAVAVAVRGGMAYLASSDAGLRIIDVSNPAAPFEVSAIQTASRANGVAVVGDLAYVTEGVYAPGLRMSPVWPSLRVIDVSNPAKLVEIGAIFGDAYDITLVDGLVYAAGGVSGLRIIDFGPEYAAPRQVAIDIRPGSEANRINPASRGVIRVAVLGSETFDVADLDLATLHFGPGAAAPSQRSRTRLADVNRDGFTDLVSHFWMRETGISSGDTRACLSGKTREGAAFRGCDAIRSQP